MKQRTLNTANINLPTRQSRFSCTPFVDIEESTHNATSTFMWLCPRIFHVILVGLCIGHTRKYVGWWDNPLKHPAMYPLPSILYRYIGSHEISHKIIGHIAKYIQISHNITQYITYNIHESIRYPMTSYYPIISHIIYHISDPIRYHLVICYIAIENDHLQWIFPLTMVISPHSYVRHYQGLSHSKSHKIPWNHHFLWFFLWFFQGSHGFPMSHVPSDPIGSRLGFSGSPLQPGLECRERLSPGGCGWWMLRCWDLPCSSWSPRKGVRSWRCNDLRGGISQIGKLKKIAIFYGSIFYFLKTHEKSLFLIWPCSIAIEQITWGYGSYGDCLKTNRCFFSDVPISIYNPDIFADFTVVISEQAMVI